MLRAVSAPAPEPVPGEGGGGDGDGAGGGGGGGGRASSADGYDSEGGEGGEPSDALAHRLAGLPVLVAAALNTHGTRAVQKLVETLSTPEQVALACAAMRPGIVLLIKDLNGNHVVQRCLQRLAPEARGGGWLAPLVPSECALTLLSPSLPFLSSLFPGGAVHLRRRPHPLR